MNLLWLLEATEFVVGTFVGWDLTTTFSHNQSKNVDFWYVPPNAGTNIPISTIVSGTSANGINYTDSNSNSKRGSNKE
ncbi:MAG: hypothetical protein AABW89_02565 [Nanoarchaeota archaeon]